MTHLDLTPFERGDCVNPNHLFCNGCRDQPVEFDALFCPECGQQVRREPPGFWRVAWGLPKAQFSHGDASALCLTRSGKRPAHPVAIERV